MIYLFVLISLGLATYCYRIGRSRDSLQLRLSVVESAVRSVEEFSAQQAKTIELLQQEKELTQEQVDYRDKVKAQYASLFKQIQDKMKEDLKSAKEETTTLVKKSREEFNKQLTEEFEKACEQIKFSEIEYKKTITKKRKEYNRKNGKNAKPQKIWRYIDEE